MSEFLRQIPSRSDSKSCPPRAPPPPRAGWPVEDTTSLTCMALIQLLIVIVEF